MHTFMITVLGETYNSKKENTAFLCIDFLWVCTLLEPHNPFIASRHHAAEPRPRWNVLELRRSDAETYVG
jgi:hypothetical protein